MAICLQQNKKHMPKISIMHIKLFAKQRSLCRKASKQISPTLIVSNRTKYKLS